MSLGLRVVLLLLVISLIAGVVTGSQLYYRLTYLWGLLLLGSWVWSRFVLSNLRFRRRARTLRAQVGQIFEERFEIDNPSRIPRFMISIVDAATLPGSQGSRVFPVIEGHRGRTYVARSRLLERGVFPLGPTILEASDPFGIFPIEREVESEDALLVYPMMVEVPSFPSPPGILPGGDALRRRTSQVTTNAAGVREYTPGDPLNRIHWLSTARRGRLISKEFELDPQAEIWLFLDAMQQAQMAIPSEAPDLQGETFWDRTFKASLPPSTEEYGVSIAASLARYFLRIGRAVGFAAAGQQVTVLPPERGGRQLGKILEALALLRAKGNLPLRGLVEIQSKHMARGSTVVLITPSVSAEVALVADFLLRRGTRPIVVLIDAASFNGPEGTDELEMRLKLLNIPVRVAHRGDNLGATLATGHAPARA